jgi:DNA-binding FadR family transcriptional regulator
MLDGHARGDATATAEADLAFHAALFEAADNVFLDALFEPLTSVLRSMRQETSAVPDFRSHALDRHAAILRAVEAGDPARARTAMEAHLHQTEEDVERYLDPRSVSRT